MYETAMINHGGRTGDVQAPNGSMKMKIEPPSIHAEGTNPEQLFAALKEHNLESDAEVKARVSLYQLDDGGYQIGVILETSLPGVEKEEAQKIIEEAHEFCPYSKATRGNIDVEVELV